MGAYMTTPLIKKVHEQVQINESTNTIDYSFLHNPEAVMGLHPDSYKGYAEQVKQLNPNIPYHQMLLDRFANGN